jgi:hypothetical protein
VVLRIGASDKGFLRNLSQVQAGSLGVVLECRPLPLVRSGFIRQAARPGARRLGLRPTGGQDGLYRSCLLSSITDVRLVARTSAVVV